MGCGTSKPATKKFTWGSTGRVYIKSLRFKAAINPYQRKIDIVYPKNLVVVSELIWNKRNFKLTDVLSIDISKKQSYQIPRKTLVFTIDQKQNFNQILNLQQITDKIIQQEKGYTTLQTRQAVKSRLENECRLFWDLSRNIWINPRYKIQKSEINSQGVSCIRCNFQKDVQREVLQKFLNSHYKVSSFNLLERGYRVSAFIQKSDQRPHIAKYRNTSLLDMNTDRGRVQELVEEVRTLIYCWDDVPGLNQQEFLAEEMERLNTGIERIVEELQRELIN